MNIKSIITVGAVAFGLFGTAPAEAEFVIDFEQVGSDVVASGSGSIDTAGLTFFSSTTTSTSFGSLTANVANFSAASPDRDHIELHETAFGRSFCVRL